MLVGSEEPKRTTQQKDKTPKSPEPVSSPASGEPRRRRRRDVVGDPPAAGVRLRPLPVVHPHRHRQRCLHLPNRVRGPRRAAGTPQTLTLASLRGIPVTMWSPPVQVGGRDGAARRVPQRRAEAAPPQHGYAALRLLAC